MKTTTSIIQPSFLPWRGYFRFIKVSQNFVFYDDVQYDKHGWRNRNQIQTNSGPLWLTVPVLTKNNFGQKINETQINYESRWAQKILKTLQINFSQWPHFHEYFPWLEKRLLAQWSSISELDIALTKDIAQFFGWKTKFHLSSELSLPKDLSRSQRLVAICQQLKSNHYLSGPSAKEYLQAENPFPGSGVELEYINYDFKDYPRPQPLTTSVSIIDLLFACGADDQWI